MRDPLVLVTSVTDDQFAQIQAAVPEATVERYAGDELADRIGSAHVVAGRVDPTNLAKAPHLKWIHSWAAGPNNQVFPEMVASPVTLTCSKGNGAVPLAEHAIMIMLMLNRDAMRWVRAQDDRRWEHRPHGELNGLTVGILGLGYSGVDLALKAKAFHMQVLGIRRNPQPTPNVDEVYGPDQLHKILPRVDFLVLTAPITEETRGMLGETEFQAMKPSAYYINFSRGGIADDDALLAALRNGWIAGAGIDAHGQEPLPADSPFWTAPNTIITPHNGATTPQTRQRAVDIFIDNLRRFVADQPLTHVVDKAAGY
ncbi:MAG: D-2-hydroxyacid dehydrogenase [Actinopolymorphaceae bacterium]